MIKNCKKMSVSAAGILLLLLPALAACQDKPDGPTPPEPGSDSAFDVYIEEVVDGKVVDTREVGRTDVIRYGSEGTGEDLVQLSWRDEDKQRLNLPIGIYIRPNIYVKSFGYRASQSEERTLVNIGQHSFHSSSALKLLSTRHLAPPTYEAKKTGTLYISVDYYKMNAALSDPWALQLPLVEHKNNIFAAGRDYGSEEALELHREILRFIDDKNLTASESAVQDLRHWLVEILYIVDENEEADGWAISDFSGERPNLMSSTLREFISYNEMYVSNQLTRKERLMKYVSLMNNIAGANNTYSNIKRGMFRVAEEYRHWFEQEFDRPYGPNLGPIVLPDYDIRLGDYETCMGLLDDTMNVFDTRGDEFRTDVFALVQSGAGDEKCR